MTDEELRENKLRELREFIAKEKIMKYKKDKKEGEIMKYKKLAKPRENYLNIGLAAQYLGVTVSTLHARDRAKRFVADRDPFNGYRIYDREALEAYGKSLGVNKKHPKILPEAIKSETVTKAELYAYLSTFNDRRLLIVSDHSMVGFIEEKALKAEAAEFYINLLFLAADFQKKQFKDRKLFYEFAEKVFHLKNAFLKNILRDIFNANNAKEKEQIKEKPSTFWNKLF